MSRPMGLLVPCPACGEVESCYDGHHICLRCEGERPKVVQVKLDAETLRANRERMERP